jgi:predicted transcriptional regulator
MEANLKYSLIEKLVNTEDDAVLNQVKDFLDVEKNHWDTLNPKLKESIETGLLQIEKGDYIPHEQVLKNIRETGRA